MTEQIFDMDNGFWRTVGKAGDMVLLTFLTFITSIPVITAGTSFCALYYVAFKILEDDNRSTIKNFFHSFRENLLQGMVLTVCMGAAGGILSFDIWFMVQAGDFGQNQALFYGGWVICAFLGLLYLILFLYLFPLQARFYNPLRVTVKNALMGGVLCLKQTVLMIVGDGMMTAIVVLCFRTVPQIAVIPVLLFLPLCACYNAWVLRTLLGLVPGKKNLPVPDEETP